MLSGTPGGGGALGELVTVGLKGRTAGGITSYGLQECPLAAIRAPDSGLSVWFLELSQSRALLPWSIEVSGGDRCESCNHLKS